jgi:uncharacterized protein (TIGR02597 family)
MKKLPLSILSALALASATQAQTTVNSDPAGFVSVVLAGDSDSYVYIPFKRGSEYTGIVSQVSGNVVTFSGTPNLAVNQFVYASPAQPKTYYALIKSGTRAGVSYTVSSNNASSVTLDLGGDDISGSVVQGTSITIAPYDTLGTVFPGGQGVNPSASHSVASRQTEILFPDLVTAGTDLASPISYYYFSGTTGAGPGWRKAGVPSSLANDTVLPLDTFFIVRHNVSTSTTLTFTGNVQMSPVAAPVVTLQAGVSQDNAVAVPFATAATLSQLKLFESGVVTGSSSHSVASRGDEVLVWLNSVTGKDKAADLSYYYFTGTTGAGPGWRLAGAASVVANNEVVLGSDRCFVVRKKGTANPTSQLWSATPPYVGQ